MKIEVDAFNMVAPPAYKQPLHLNGAVLLQIIRPSDSNFSFLNVNVPEKFSKKLRLEKRFF